MPNRIVAIPATEEYSNLIDEANPIPALAPSKPPKPTPAENLARWKIQAAAVQSEAHRKATLSHRDARTWIGGESDRWRDGWEENRRI